MSSNDATNDQNLQYERPAKAAAPQQFTPGPSNSNIFDNAVFISPIDMLYSNVLKSKTDAPDNTGVFASTPNQEQPSKDTNAEAASGTEQKFHRQQSNPGPIPGFKEYIDRKLQELGVPLTSIKNEKETNELGAGIKAIIVNLKRDKGEFHDTTDSPPNMGFFMPANTAYPYNGNARTSIPLPNSIYKTPMNSNFGVPNNGDVEEDDICYIQHRLLEECVEKSLKLKMKKSGDNIW